MTDIIATIEEPEQINVTISSSMGINNFLELTDTPSTYTGESGKFLKIKDTEDGVEFTSRATVVKWGDVTGTLSDQIDLQSALDLKEENLTFSTGLTRTLNTITVNNSELALTASQISIVDANDYYLSTEIEGVLEEIGETRAINGYDLTVIESLPDLDFNTTTRVFTTSVKGGSSDYYFWVDSKKFTKTGDETVTLPDITDTYYIYFDNAGALKYVAQSGLNPEQFYENAITGLVYWNKTAGSAIVGNELHGKLMDARTHNYNHSTFGARYESGLDITGLTDSGDTYTNISSGYFWDEDIRHTVSLTTNAPFIYRLGATGEWTGTTPDLNVSYNAGGSYDVWNEWTGSTWQLSQGTSSTDYWIIFTIATPDLSGYQIKKIIGQNAYSSRSRARAALDTEINKLVTDGLPSPEFIFLQAWIVKRNGTLEDDGDGNTYIDLRNFKGGVGSTSGSASLASDVATNTTNFNTILSSTDTTTQLALDTLDDHTHSDYAVAGSDGQIQFNDSGVFGADSNLYWDNANKRLGIGIDSPGFNLVISSADPRIVIEDTDGSSISLRSINGQLEIGKTAVNNVLTIDVDNKNIGINETSPDSLLTLSQYEDSNGIKINGYDDKSGQNLRLNVSADGDGQIFGSQSIVYIAEHLYFKASHYLFGNNSFNNNPDIKFYGQIGSVGRKYIQFQVDDTDDKFHLTREDSNILGFDIDMPVTMGTGSTSHSLGSSGDLLVSGKLEVDGVSEFDGGINNNSVYFTRIFGDSVDFSSYWRNYATYLNMAAYIDDGFHLALSDGNGESNNNLIIVPNNHRLLDFGHDTLSPDPTLFIHSNTNPDTDNTQWLSMTHDKTDAIFKTGTGDFKFEGDILSTGNNASSIEFKVNNDFSTGASIFRMTTPTTQWHFEAKGDNLRFVESGIAFRLIIKEGGNVSIGSHNPDTKLDVNGAITQRELSSDPSDPDEGASVTWQSDGTGSGDDGDIMMKITAGGTTKTITLIDFSAA